MNDLAPGVMRLIDRYQPVTMEGLTLYPVTVDDYDYFINCAPALGFMQQSLPVTMLTIPLVTAFLRMEDAWNAKMREETETGDTADPKTGALFSASVLALLLALRLGEGEPMDERFGRLRLVFDPKHPEKLQKLVFRGNEGEAIEISPAKFAKLRPVIAAQNGIEIPPLDANPELVEADRAVRNMNAPDLEISIPDKIAFVCNETGKDESEVNQWPILKFNRRAALAERKLRYLVYGIGESSGMVKYKDGNPCPSPIFAKVEKSKGMIALSDFRKGAEQEINKAHQNQ